MKMRIYTADTFRGHYSSCGEAKESVLQEDTQVFLKGSCPVHANIYLKFKYSLKWDYSEDRRETWKFQRFYTRINLLMDR